MTKRLLLADTMNSILLIQQRYASHALPGNSTVYTVKYTTCFLEERLNYVVYTCNLLTNNG